MTIDIVAQPDVTLLLDGKGVIRQAKLSDAFADEGVAAWLGQPWADTVGLRGGGGVRRMIDAARDSGLSAFLQVTQRFPSGLELPMEYTTVRVDGAGGLIAIGRNVQVVAELQSRLVAAQQALERDFWKFRDVETRYRLLFDASSEAMLLVRAADLRVVEANPAAIRALGPAPVGLDILAELGADERQPFNDLIARIRAEGRAPGIVIHLGPTRRPWMVRASLMTSESGQVVLLQLSPAVGRPAPAVAPADKLSPGLLAEAVGRLPDSFALVDRAGVVVLANAAFPTLVQIASERAAVGENLGRWLNRPGADIDVLLAAVRSHGCVRLFSTAIRGELGTETDVEISAVGIDEYDPRFFAIMIRDIGQRLAAVAHRGPEALPRPPVKAVGSAPLQELVRETTDLVERHYIDAALERTKGNRTAAADLLGLSRQSLYAKLGRFGFDGIAAPSPRPE